MVTYGAQEMNDPKKAYPFIMNGLGSKAGTDNPTSELRRQPRVIFVGNK